MIQRLLPTAALASVLLGSVIPARAAVAHSSNHPASTPSLRASEPPKVPQPSLFPDGLGLQPPALPSFGRSPRKGARDRQLRFLLVPDAGPFSGNPFADVDHRWSQWDDNPR
jgi:hypothetical protein